MKQRPRILIKNRVNCNMSCILVHAQCEYEPRLVSSPHDLTSVLNFKLPNSKLLTLDD